MKTVIHGKSILKAILLVAATGIALGLICAALEIPPGLSGLIGMTGGAVAMLWSMSRWDMWHFE